jgi:hypothetical protein
MGITDALMVGRRKAAADHPDRAASQGLPLEWLRARMVGERTIHAVSGGVGLAAAAVRWGPFLWGEVP